MKVVLRIKKNKLGTWPFARDENGKKIVFSSFKKASDYAKIVSALEWHAKRIDLIR